MNALPLHPEDCVARVCILSYLQSLEGESGRTVATILAQRLLERSSGKDIVAGHIAPGSFAYRSQVRITSDKDTSSIVCLFNG